MPFNFASNLAGRKSGQLWPLQLLVCLSPVWLPWPWVALATLRVCRAQLWPEALLFGWRAGWLAGSIGRVGVCERSARRSARVCARVCIGCGLVGRRAREPLVCGLARRPIRARRVKANISRSLVFGAVNLFAGQRLRPATRQKGGRVNRHDLSMSLRLLLMLRLRLSNENNWPRLGSAVAGPKRARK